MEIGKSTKAVSAVYFGFAGIYLLVELYRLVRFAGATNSSDQLSGILLAFIAFNVFQGVVSWRFSKLPKYLRVSAILLGLSVAAILTIRFAMSLLYIYADRAPEWASWTFVVTPGFFALAYLWLGLTLARAEYYMVRRHSW